MTEATPAGTQPPRHPGHPDPFSPGERILLIDRKQRRYVQTLTPGAVFHFHGGMVEHDALLGRPEGTRVVSSRQTTLLAWRLTASDWTLKAPRGAQVVYPKDQAMIVALADVRPGARVVEAGAGSGALTCALLQAVGPSGHLVSFERREDHATVALRNVGARLGCHPGNWELRVADAVEGLASTPCERVVLDLLEPWELVAPAWEALHPGGLILAYTPTVTQVMRFREALEAHGGWALAQTSETLLRTWNVDGLAVRPDHRMVAHTAFLSVARRLPAA